MTAGRPTDYKPEYCERVIEYGRAGKSITWMAASLDVAKSTLYLWIDEHPEFSDAITRARQLSQQWWEDAGQNALASREFNAPVWSKSMAARFPDEWRDSAKHEHTGSDGGAIQHAVTHMIEFVDAEKQD